MAILDVVIDYGKCANPRECAKCLQVCPIAVFGLAAIKTLTPDGKTVKNFKIFTPDADMCNGCGGCIEVCPQNAIRIVYS